MNAPDHPIAPTAARGAVGGLLMGLANLVPGISGGTMLLAVGIYPRFIRGVAEVSTLRFRLRSMILLACVASGWAIVLVGLAGTVKDLFIDHSWIMYSLFIGLTLGGVPVIWRLVKPADRTLVIASIAGILAMVALVAAQAAGSGSGEPSGDAAPAAHLSMLLLAGVAGSAAMILPGISGGYLLLVLGQYVIILGAIDAARAAVLARDWAGLGDPLKVLVPVAVGMAIGVIGVSNLIKVLLDRFPRATLGFLLGLLLGAVVGLWPFQAAPGTEAQPPDPTPLRLAAALGLAGVGFLASAAVSRLGGNEADNTATT